MMLLKHVLQLPPSLMGKIVSSATLTKSSTYKSMPAFLALILILRVVNAYHLLAIMMEPMLMRVNPD